MTTTIQDNAGKEKTITVTQDEGIRGSTTMEGLAKLKPAFKENGSTTAGEGMGRSGLVSMLRGPLPLSLHLTSPVSPRKLQPGERWSSCRPAGSQGQG